MVTVAIEVVLGVVALLAGNFLWQIWKRDRFLKHLIHNADFLSRAISSETLDNALSGSSPFLEALPQGYSLKLQLAIAADRKSIRILQLIFGSLVLAVLVASYFLGYAYLAVNATIFFLTGLARVSEQARVNAAKHILEIAVILDRWRSQNLAECEAWVGQAWSLRQVYDAVAAARTCARLRA